MNQQNCLVVQSGGPTFIYLPEFPFSKEQFLADIRGKLKTHNNVIVAVSEGIPDRSG